VVTHSPRATSPLLSQCHWLTLTTDPDPAMPAAGRPSRPAAALAATTSRPQHVGRQSAAKQRRTRMLLQGTERAGLSADLPIPMWVILIGATR
jgi:hypothetical protein